MRRMSFALTERAPMTHSWHLALALVTGWAIGTVWPAPERATTTTEVAALRALLLEEIAAAESRAEQRDQVVRGEMESALDDHRASARTRAGDLFCLAVHPRLTAPNGYRYASNWAWLNCNTRR